MENINELSKLTYGANAKTLLERWNPLLDVQTENTQKITSPSMKLMVAQLCENQTQYEINESVSSSDVATFTPMLIPAVRRIMPMLMANEIVGIQPMKAPNGYAYALRYKYAGSPSKYNTGTSEAPNYVSGELKGVTTKQRGNLTPTNRQPDFDSQILVFDSTVDTTKPEFAPGKEITQTASGKTAKGVVVHQGVRQLLVKLTAVDSNSTPIKFVPGTTVSTGASDIIAYVANNEAGYNVVLPNYSGWHSTSDAEKLGSIESVHGTDSPMKEMGLTIEQISVEAKSRKLKAKYTLELAQDMKAMHGLDAEAELLSILEYEIAAEIDRDLVNRINSVATQTPQWSYISPETAVDGRYYADGRYEMERFRTLYTRVTKEANEIAKTTRRGSGNFVIASTNALTALSSLNNYIISPVNNNINPSSFAKAGSLDGRMTIYHDTFATYDYITIGFKGANAYDTGVVYCPYQPLQMTKVVDPYTGQPTLMFNQRSGIVENLFGANLYYRTFMCDFTGSSIAGIYPALP